MRTARLREARNKLRTVRAADTDTITVRLVATIYQRHGRVMAGGKPGAVMAAPQAAGTAGITTGEDNGKT